MDMDPPAQPWFSALPLSDPRCDNTSCTAFNNAYLASQGEISWLSQFLYGHWTAWIFAAVIFLFSLRFWVQKLLTSSLMSKSFNNTKKTDKPSLWERLVALVRLFSYRPCRRTVCGELLCAIFGSRGCHSPLLGYCNHYGIYRAFLLSRKAGIW